MCIASTTKWECCKPCLCRLFKYIDVFINVYKLFIFLLQYVQKRFSQFHSKVLLHQWEKFVRAAWPWRSQSQKISSCVNIHSWDMHANTGWAKKPDSFW